jgi:pimeloyl-ACP methyl ester carboxylesterase
MSGGRLALLLLALIVAGERPASATGRWLRRAGLEPRWCEVEGLRVRYVRKGTGPSLLLLHGLGSSIYSWSEVIDGFARRHDVVALDLPGFGGSDAPADLTLRRLVVVVPAVMDRLGVERASLIGNSLGGAVAALLAVELPVRVERLVLIDSAGFNFSREKRPALLRLVGAVPAGVLERLPVRRALTRAALRQVFFDRSKLTDERVEEYVAPLQRPGAVRSLGSLLSSREAGAGAFGELLARISAPTLILWGNEDRWVPVADADRFAGAIAGSRTIILKRCGHLPQEERPAETLALVESFLGAR